MDFREEYFENKLKHVSEEMTLISKQLMLIQDFIMFEFGSKFKGFCESRRGGRYFRESHAMNDVHQEPASIDQRGDTRRMFVVDNLIGNTSVPVMPLGNVNRRVFKRVTNNKTSGCNSNSRALISGTIGVGINAIPRPSISNSAGILEYLNYSSTKSSEEGGGGDNSSTHWNLPDVSKEPSALSLALSSNITSEPGHGQERPEVSAQLQDIVSSIMIPTDANPNDKKMYVDESEGGNGFDPLGGISVDKTSTANNENRSGDGEGDGDGEIVFVKCEPENESTVEEIAFNNSGNDDSAQGSISQEGFIFDANDVEEPCSSQPFSINQPDFKNSSNSGFNNFDMNEEELSSTVGKRKAKCQDPPYYYPGPGTTTARKNIRTDDLFGDVPWKSHYKKLSNGEILCIVNGCHRTLSNIHKYRRHFLSHTGIKPYKCDLCAAAYTRNDQLTTHKNKQHAVAV